MRDSEPNASGHTFAQRQRFTAGIPKSIGSADDAYAQRNCVTAGADPHPVRDCAAGGPGAQPLDSDERSDRR